MPLNFQTLREFADSLELGDQFPLKVMGSKEIDRRTKAVKTYYTATMLADIYRHTDDPDLKLPAQAPFGSINRKGCTLSNAFTAQIIAASDGSNVFQGDVLVLQKPFTMHAYPHQSVKRIIVISHSCDVSKPSTPALTVCPIFTESELDHGFVSFLRDKQTDAITSQQIVQNWTRNEGHYFFSLPAHGGLSQNIPDEPLIAPLALALPFARTELIQLTPDLRLNYRTNAFFQMRLLTLLARDVQRSDETRDF